MRRRSNTQRRTKKYATPLETGEKTNIASLHRHADDGREQNLTHPHGANELLRVEGLSAPAVLSRLCDIAPPRV